MAGRKQFQMHSSLADEHKMKPVAIDDNLEAVQVKYEVSQREGDLEQVRK
jgi:hypothetical protein